MSADYQDILAKLAIQANQQPQPSFAGISAPQDPAQIQNVLSKLRLQQYQDSAANLGATPGQYGYLHDQVTKGWQAQGYGMGQALQQASQGAPQQSPQGTALKQAILGAQAQYSQDLQSGVPPQQAKLNALTKMAQAGVPGVDTQIEAVQKDIEKSNETKSIVDKNTEQAKSYANTDSRDKAKETREALQNTWTTISPAGNNYVLQQNGLGEKRSIKVNDEKPQAAPLTPEQATNVDAIAKKVANYELPISVLYGRGASGSDKADALARVMAHNTDYDDKNYKQSNDAIKAYGPSGTLGQQTVKLQNAINHLSLLNQYGKALDSGDVNLANKIANHLSGEFGGVPIAGYNAIAPIVASEVSSALIKGGGGQEERADKARSLGAQLSTPARASATQGMASLLSAQYKNYKNNYEKTTLRKNFEDLYPIEGGFGNDSIASPQPSQAGPTASAGWGTPSLVKP